MVEARVFISMGTPYTDEHRDFRDKLESFLRDSCDVNPRIIGKNEYPEGSPLTKIKDVMSKCHGVIVVAYERKFLKAGQEKRYGLAPVSLNDEIYTTPWNHIESAMAYTLGLPIYVLCQRGLKEEGLIEDKIDWYVKHLEISSEELNKPDVVQSLNSWIEGRVIPFSKKPNIMRAVEGNSRISDMTPKEIFGILAVLIATFSAGAALASALPQIF